MEQDIFELWKVLNPSAAFSQGIEEYAGRLFIPTTENKAKIQAAIDSLKHDTQDDIYQKFLTYLDTKLNYDEPPLCPSEILWTFFGHISKEGINTQHLGTLAENSMRLVDAYTAFGYNWPIEIKILTYRGCKGLLGILATIRKQTNDVTLIDKLTGLEQKVSKYMANFQVTGLDKCDFDEIYPILSAKGKEMDRSEIYPRLLVGLYDYYESPTEIEAKGLGWLDDELPNLKALTGELSETYGVKPTVEAVAEALTKRNNVKKSEILMFISELRSKLQKVIEKNLVRIAPEYRTKVVETPGYLLNFIPSAAMSPYDTLTSDPFNIFFVTTDEGRSPPTGAADIFQVLVHEEYGHCMNFTNTALQFAAKPTLLERMSTTFHYPISEAISFNREVEALELLKELEKRDVLDDNERELMAMLEKMGDLELFIKEIEFVVYEWRVIRFLRAIGDVRINTSKMSITEFVDWAHEYTGLSKKLIFNQIFIFQESPGYAPCYSIAGQALREIQRNAKDVIEFNTIAASLGFPPRTVFEERLKNI